MQIKSNETRQNEHVGEGGFYKENLDPLDDSKDELSTLDAKFFAKDFDPIMHIFDTLPLKSTKAELQVYLESEIGAMDLKRDIVQSKLAAHVQKNYTEFIKGMRQVHDVDLDISKASIHARNSRRILQQVEQHVVIIVRKRRNVDRIRQITKCCEKVIQCFQQERLMHDSVQNQDFALAISTCAALRDLLRDPDLRKLTMLNALRNRMNTALLEMQYQFDAVLQQMVLEFIPATYGKLCDAYVELENHSRQYPQLEGRIDDIPQIIHSMIIQTAKKRCKFILQDTSTLEISSENLVLNSYCADQLLVDLTKCFHDIADLMHSYYLILQWHRNAHASENLDPAYLHRGDDILSNIADLESDRFKELATSLIDGRTAIWDELQDIVKNILETRHVERSATIEQLILISAATTDFMNMGIVFCGNSADKIQKGLESYSKRFLLRLHCDNQEKIKMLLDTEDWKRISCPLQGYHGLLRLIETKSGYAILEKSVPKAPMELNFASFLAHGNPFENADTRYRPSAIKNLYRDPLTDMQEAIFEDDDEYKKFETSEEVQVRIYGSKYVVCTSTESGFLRMAGMYMKLIQQLPSVSDETCVYSLQLFDVYLYAIAVGFIPEKYLIRIVTGLAPSDMPCDALRHNLERIRLDLKLGERYPTTETTATLPRTEKMRRLPIPLIRPVLQGDKPLDALAERTVAAESLVFLLEVLKNSRSVIQYGVSEAQFETFEAKISEFTACVAQVRSFVYASTAPELIRMHDIPQMIIDTTWDLSHLSEGQNTYVMTIIRVCGSFWGSLPNLANATIPASVCDEIWNFIIRAIMESLVEGYAKVTNCTTEGRALMSMDLQGLLKGLDSINSTSSTNLYGRSYVNNFIQAFYYNPEDLHQWIRENKTKYQSSHLVRLVLNGVGQKMKRKTLHDYLESLGFTF